jgi:hypothetical protein
LEKLGKQKTQNHPKFGLDIPKGEQMEPPDILRQYATIGSHQGASVLPYKQGIGGSKTPSPTNMTCGKCRPEENAPRAFALEFGVLVNIW